MKLKTYTKTTRDCFFVNCNKNDKPIERTKTKTQEILNIIYAKSMEILPFYMLLSLESIEWMLRLTSLEVFNAGFSKTEESVIFELSKPIEKKHLLVLERF